MRSKVTALLRVRRLEQMTPTIRRDIARWLRRLAGRIERKVDTYAPVFTARYERK